MGDENETLTVISLDLGTAIRLLADSLAVNRCSR